MVVDSLEHRDPDPDVEGYLPPAELLRRVADRFPLAVIDRERADRLVRAAADGLVRLGLPPTDSLVQDQRSLAGRVAYVTVREREGGPRFGFFLYPHPTVIDIDYDRPEDRAACRPLLEALAAAIDYDVVSDDLSAESDPEEEAEAAAAHAALPAMRMRWVGDVAVIRPGAAGEGEPVPPDVMSDRWWERNRGLIIDLTGSEDGPSAAVAGWMSRVDDAARSTGKRLWVVCPPGPVRDALSPRRSHLVVPIWATLADALAELGPPAG